MSKAIETTLNMLRSLSRTTDAVCVSYSDGKDSRVVMDLCVRSFKKVHAFFMYFLPDLHFMNERLEAAEARWGVKIRQYPHWAISRYLQMGVYCDRVFDLVEWKLDDVHTLVRADTKCPLIAIGAKKADGVWRRRNVGVYAKRADICMPIVEWVKEDVIAYLSGQGIPIEKEGGRLVGKSGIATVGSGATLSDESLFHIHDNYPDDFQRIVDVFPFAESAIYRRKFYGEEQAVKRGSGRRRKASEEEDED